MKKMMLPTFDKHKLVKRVSNKLNHAVPQKMIYNVVVIILDYIVEVCATGNVFSVKNFGSIYPALTRRGCHRRNVKFRPHLIFDSLIKKKKAPFFQPK